MKNILLIGETGTGKSSLGNFLLGEDIFKVSDDPLSGTKKITGKQNKIDNIFVIDTPGYQDSDGDDRKNFKDILEYFCKNKKLELLLMTLNYKSPRLPFTIINLIKFLCHAFPKKLCNHIGFVFTHYHDEYEKETCKTKDSKENKKKKYISKIMEIISEETKEKLFLGPPVFFVDSYIRDSNSKEELNRLIYFAKSLNSIDVFQKKDLYIKEEIDEYDNRKSVYEEEDYIITKIDVYKRKKQIYYDGTENYTNWKFSHSNKNKEKKKEIEIEEIEEKEEKEEKKFGFFDGLLMIGGIAMIVYDYFSRKNKQNIKPRRKKF